MIRQLAIVFLCLMALLASVSADKQQEFGESLVPEGEDGFMRYFRSSGGGGKPTFIRFGKRAQPSFIRFGRAQPSFIRFGRSAGDLVEE